MPHSRNQILIERLSNDPRLLRVQIKSHLTHIRACEWSLDWHLKHTPNATIDDDYSRRTQTKIQCAKGFLQTAQDNLDRVMAE